MDYVCAQCGKAFSRQRRSPPSVNTFCSVECKRAYSYVTVKTKYTCQYCGKVFQARPRKNKTGEYQARKYCSRKCADDSKHILEEGICEVCGQSFWDIPSKIKRQKYCSIKCAAKMWKENGTYNKMWKTHSKNCAERRINKVCEYCGKKFTTQPCHEAQKYCGRTCQDKALIKYNTEEERRAARIRDGKKARAKLGYSEYQKEYRARPDVKARHRIATLKHENKMRATPVGRLERLMRHRIRMALKEGRKSAKTVELLGCSVERFQKYFFSLFTGAMTITSFMDGHIHIDHIRPCKSFDLNDPQQQKQCFHYTNLQPLWATDNLKKSATWV